MTTLGATPPATTTDIVSAVREAAAAAPKRARAGGFSLSRGGTGEQILAPIIGLYLGYAVVRIPEVFEALFVPRLPMVLMVVFLVMLGFAIPSDAWKLIWEKSKALRLVIYLAGVSIVTAQIGIWPSESYLFLRENYFISVAIFAICLVLLRDRRNLRLAVSVYVLCVTAVSYQVVHTYDPNAEILNEDGDPIDPDVVAARPELRRLAYVGDSLDSNDFGAILVASFPLALWLSVGSFRRRVFWTGTAMLMVMAVVPTQSRGSELGFIAAAAVIVSVGARGWRRLLSFGLVAGCVAIFVMMAVGIGAAGRFSDFGDDDYNLSNDGRWFFWKQGFIWMLKRPWGYGISNYTTYFGMLNGQERAAHSTWVQYGMELGVAGLVLFVTICYLLVKHLNQYRKRAAAMKDSVPEAKDEAVLAGHMIALLAGCLVTGSFLSNAYYALTYMALGLAGATLLGSPLPDAEVTAPAHTPKSKPVAGGIRRRQLRQFPGHAPAG